MKYRDIDLHDGTVYIAPVKEGLMEIPISNADAAVNKLADYIEKQEADLRKLVERWCVDERQLVKANGTWFTGEAKAKGECAYELEQLLDGRSE